MDLVNLINLGGPLNWLLFFLLCFCFCQCVERGLYLFQTRRGAKGDVVARYRRACSELDDAEQEYEALYFEMNRGLWLLNFISAAAPSVGLLGTVTGLISAFQGMAAAGAQVGMQDLSGGIWEAMLTTAFGMIISIPALFFYRFFRRIIEKRLFAMDRCGRTAEK
ncbi:MAG: MotA/TolQ/ExbB proton channel family protein [Treponemataceae bacterium]|nr:MotA/TolQ/ExbB proton channel family protein [Treponemataceae bacterium]